ncbi:PAS domain-containing protein [Vibrio metschnikovii]
MTPEHAAQDASPAFERIHPDDLQGISDSIEHSANTLEYWQATYRVRYQGQDYRWFAGQAKPERLSDGSVLWHGYLHDIHEQEQARQTTERMKRDCAVYSIFHRLVSHLTISKPASFWF